MRLYTLAASLILLSSAPASATNWPAWRGPSGNGVAPDSNPPVEWSAAKGTNIAWKTLLPAWSGSTPAVWGKRVYVTSPSMSQDELDAEVEPQGRGRRDPGGDTLLLIALDAADGSEIWRRELARGNELHRKGNNASPSPVTDGKHVWAVTGVGTVSAFTTDGEPVWTADLQKTYGAFGHQWGYASSPLLHDGRLIVEVLHGMHTDAPSYVVAFDAASGEVLWKQDRPTDARRESPDAYTTPAVVTYEGRTSIVITGGDVVTAHDPRTGHEVWRADGLNPNDEGNYRIVASPVVAGGLIFAPTRKRPLLALRPGGTGDVTTSHLVWKRDEGAEPDVPTPVSDGAYLYLVDDKGLATCLEAATGEVVWGPERTAPGTVSASPVLAGGRLYILNENAVTTVLNAGPEFGVLATNELDGTYTLASPAVAGDRLYIRTATHLYCISSD